MAGEKLAGRIHPGMFVHVMENGEDRVAPLSLLLGLYEGNGAPGFAVETGSFYRRLDGGSGTTLYINQDGSLTGWAPVASFSDLTTLIASITSGTATTNERLLLLEAKTDDLLTEMRLMNLHLAEMTGERFHELEVVR